MKRFILFLLFTLTCFNLAGGYAIAATVVNAASAEIPLSHPLSHNPDHLIVKQASSDILLLQVTKSESEEEEDLVNLALHLYSHANSFLSYTPDFRLLNKHFLVHYVAAIKSKGLAAFILYHNFRL